MRHAMRKIRRASLILVPLAIIIVMFAVANREIVTVSFDPFDAAHPAFALKMPLFLLIFALVGVGVVVGGIAAWLRQHKWRMRARRAEAEARDLRARLDAEQPRRNVPARWRRRRRSSCRRRRDRDRDVAMRVVTADDINRVLSYDALIDALAEAFRADIAAPDKIAHFIPQPSGSEAKVLLMPAWTNVRRALHRPQARQRVSRQRQARQAGGARQLRADVGRHRRDARGDGRRGADRLAHRLRLRAGGALSRARGRLASRHDRRRRAGAASHPRAPRGAADHARDACGTGRARTRSRPRSRCRPPASSRPSPTIWKRRCARPTSCPARRCRRRRSFAAPG